MLGVGVAWTDVAVVVLSAREAMRLRSILKEEADADMELIEDVAAGRESTSQLHDALARLKVCARVEHQLPT